MPRKPKAADGATLGTRVGRTIKAARILVGMTQGALAEAIDVDNVTLSRIETGAQLPSLDRLERIAGVLGLSLQALVAEEGSQFGPAATIVHAINELPEREQVFLMNYVLDYSRHWKEGHASK